MHHTCSKCSFVSTLTDSWASVCLCRTGADRQFACIPIVVSVVLSVPYKRQLGECLFV